MKHIFKIIKISKPLHKSFGIVSALILVQAILQQATPVTLKFIVDEITTQVKSGDGSLSTLTNLIVLIFIINIVNTALNAVSQRIGDYLSSRLGKYLTEVFYKKIFTLPQKYFDSEISGKIVNQLTRGIVSIQEFIGAASNFILPAFLQSIFTISVLTFFNPLIGGLAFIIFPVYIAISSYSTKKWGERQVLKNEIEDVARGRIQEVISNIKLVKTFNTQSKEWKFISKKYTQHIKIYDKQSLVYQVLNFTREFGLEITLVTIFVVTFRQTFNSLLTIGEMVLVLQLLNQLRRPLFAMSFILERIQRAEADSKAFFEIIDLESTEKFTSSKLKMFKNPKIHFNDVTFQYEDDQKVLAGVNLTFDKQETVALVGHSGAGKSTLVNLLLKFYEPTSGEIKINNNSYQNLNHHTVRNQISLVFQDNELFSSTVRENVAYGLEDKVTDKEIIKALKQANAYSFVMKLKGGLDAQIGERGVKLSGGQKQRLQIARAIIHNAPILILDEATSNLDSKSERLVQEALEKLFKNRLVIIIAHRFSTIQNVDRIIVINDGTIEDSGKPSELATRKGIYSELLRYQVEGNKKLLSQYDLF